MCAQRILRGGPPSSIKPLTAPSGCRKRWPVSLPALIGGYEAVGGSSGCASAQTRADASEGAESLPLSTLTLPLEALGVDDERRGRANRWKHRI